VAKYANYGVFTVADEDHKYRIRVDSYTGNAGMQICIKMQYVKTAVYKYRYTD
jgi:hypothetical protein